MRRPLVVALTGLTFLFALASAAAGQPSDASADATLDGSADVPLDSPASTVVPVVPPTASSPSFTDDESSSAAAAAMACSGTNDLLRGPDLRRGSSPTVWENYCSSGYTFHEDLGWTDVKNKALNGVASFLMSLAGMLANAIITCFQWAFSPNLLAGFGSMADDVVEALQLQIFVPFLLAVIAATGVWGAWHGVLKRRATFAIEGWVWAIIALTAATWFMARPGVIFDGANNVITGATASLLAAVDHIDPGTMPDDGMASQAQLGRGADDTLRRAADRVHRTLIHQPWLIGQFGSTDVGHLYGERLLAAQTLTTQEWEDAGDDPRRIRDLMERKNEDKEDLSKEVEEDHPEAYEWFRGTRSAQRIGVASLALLATALAGGLILLIAVSVIVLKLAIFLLILLSPLFFVIGIHPGLGRVVLLRWAELLLGSVIKAMFLAAMLATLIVSYGVILASSTSIGWGASVMLIILLGVAAVIYRKPFARMFSSLGLPAAAGPAGQQATSAESLHAQRSRPLSTAKKAVFTAMAFKYMGGRKLGQAATMSNGNGRAAAGNGGLADAGDHANGNGHRPTARAGSSNQGAPPDGDGGGSTSANDQDTVAHDTTGEPTSSGRRSPGRKPTTSRAARDGGDGHKGRTAPIYTPLPVDPTERRRRLEQQRADANKPNSGPGARARRQMLEDRLQQVTARERARRLRDSQRQATDTTDNQDGDQ